MPFTFSHPAIVLPFQKIRHASISMSGLVIGSITPDFEYFIKMKLSGRFSHSLEGMLLFDLPLAIVLAIIFHQVVKKSLIDNLPGYFHNRLYVLRNFSFHDYLKKYYWSFFGCLLVGIGSHILWDSFTHANEYFVEHVEYLSTPVAIDGLPGFPLFRYLQHGSTVVGAIFILFAFHRLPVHAQENNPSLSYWLVLIVVASISFVVRALFTFEYFGDIVTTIISSGIIGLIASSIFYRFYNG